MAPKPITKKEWLEMEKLARKSLPKAIQNQDEFLEHSGYKELTNSFIKDEIKKEVFNTNVPVNFNHLTSIKLKELIDKDGKIPFSKFMQECLYGKDGYYSSGKVKIGNYGSGCDFTTSPEVSEIFGGSIANSAVKLWESMGKPEKFDIVEMGAGRGKLAHDFIKWAEKNAPDFYKTINYIILEYSPALIQTQREKIRAILSSSELSKKIKWINGSAYELPLKNVQGLIYSNELPDAFPVERVTLLNGQIKQKFITIQNNQWTELLSDPSQDVLDYINQYNISLTEGIEEPININASYFQEQICQSLEKGGVLTVDYGRNGEIGNIKHLPIRHYGRVFGNPKREDLLTIYKYPGELDITADVNFNPLEKIGLSHGLNVEFAGNQGDFLNENKINHDSDNEEINESKKLLDKDFDCFYVQMLTKNANISPSVH